MESEGKMFKAVIGGTIRSSLILLILVAIVLLLTPWLCTWGQTERIIKLGFVDNCTPAIFTKLESGMTIKISSITYNKSGVPEAYTEEIQYRVGKPIVIKVMVKKWISGDCNSIEYIAEVDGKQFISTTVNAFRKADTAGLIAFSPEGGAAIGVVGRVIGVDRKTEFSYDKSGRRQIARESYTSPIRCEVIYSDYSYNDVGGLSGYTAKVRL